MFFSPDLQNTISQPKNIFPKCIVVNRLNSILLNAINSVEFNENVITFRFVETIDWNVMIFKNAMKLPISVSNNKLYSIFFSNPKNSPFVVKIESGNIEYNICKDVFKFKGNLYYSKNLTIKNEILPNGLYVVDFRFTLGMI
jgi:hypothetical protein